MKARRAQGRPRWVALVMLSAVVWLALAGPAHAGSYEAWACHTDDGGPATFPTSVGVPFSGAWSWVGDGQSGWTVACGADEMGVSLAPHGADDGKENLSMARYVAPSDTTIDGWSYARRFIHARSYYPDAQRYEVSADGRSLRSVTLTGNEDDQGTVVERFTDLKARELRVGFRCPGTCTYYSDKMWPPRDPALQLAWQRLVVRDDFPPTVRAVSGPLTEAPELRGDKSVTAQMSDRGSGVYRLLAQLGDQIVAAPVLDPKPRCEAVDGGLVAPYLFRSTLPCKLDVDSTVTVATTGWPEGPGTLSLLVEDAAGNRTLAVSPRQVRVNNRLSPDDPLPASVTAPNGVNASERPRFEFVGRARRTLAAGRGVTVGARLIDPDDRPIRGALVDLAERVALPGVDWRPVSQVRSDEHGAVRVRLAAGPSRIVRLGYRKRLGDTEPAAIADIRLDVAAKSSLRPSRRSARNRQRVRFSGRVRPGPVPASGVLVELQAWTGTRWQPFRTARSDGRGRWRAGYRFERTTERAATYAFRAAVTQDSGYPYRRGLSRVVKIHVRP